VISLLASVSKSSRDQSLRPEGRLVIHFGEHLHVTAAMSLDKRSSANPLREIDQEPNVGRKRSVRTRKAASRNSLPPLSTVRRETGEPKANGLSDLISPA